MVVTTGGWKEEPVRRGFAAGDGGCSGLLLVEPIDAGGFLFVQIAGRISRGARLLTRSGKLQALAATNNLDWTVRSFYRREWRRWVLLTARQGTRSVARTVLRDLG